MYAVDLHLHSCLSPCGDALMTPGNIAGMCFLKGLDAIALTDHNSARNLPAMQAACAEYGIALLPGIEATTSEEVHVLCYFESVEAACAFGAFLEAHLPQIRNRPDIFGEQTICGAGDEEIGKVDTLLISATDLSIDALVAHAAEYGGVCVPAHVNRGANSLLPTLGFLPLGVRFAAVEIDRRADVPKYFKTTLPILHSSDAHYLENILELEFFLPMEENTTKGVFRHIKRALDD